MATATAVRPAARKEVSVAHKRLVKARMALILMQPFFGVLATRLIIRRMDSVKTCATDGKYFYYNDAYVMSKSDAELKGLWAHEVLHCSNGHIWRKGDREHHLWNVAADYVIDPIAMAANLVVPDPMVRDDFRGRSAEYAYSILFQERQLKRKQEEEERKREQEEREKNEMGCDFPQPGDSEEEESSDDAADQDGDGDGEGEGDDDQDGQGDAGNDESSDGTQDGQPGDDDQKDGGGKPQKDEPQEEPVTKGEIMEPASDTPAEDESNWQIATIQAANAARAQGKLPGCLEQFVKEAVAPKTDWRATTRRFMQQLAAADYSYRLPSSRYQSMGLYMPRLQSEALPPIVVVFDDSGSCWNEQDKFFAELGVILEECKPELIHFIQVDDAVQNAEELLPGDPIIPNVKGGGGTSFVPAFDWVEEQGIMPAAMIYFTDLYGSYPPADPGYPVLWASVTKEPPANYVPPFGETIYVGE